MAPALLVAPVLHELQQKQSANVPLPPVGAAAPTTHVSMAASARVHPVSVPDMRKALLQHINGDIYKIGFVFNITLNTHFSIKYLDNSH